jgi:hypothetical protein
MVTEKISKIEHSLGKKNGILECFFEPKLDLFLDAKNRKFHGTLRIGSLRLETERCGSNYTMMAQV